MTETGSNISLHIRLTRVKRLSRKLKTNPTVTRYSYSRWESIYVRFHNEKVRSKANEIKCLRADPEQGIRASLYRIMV